MKKILILPLFLCIWVTSYADNYITLNQKLSIQMPGAYPDTFSRGKLTGYSTYWYRIFYEALSKKDKSIPPATATNSEFEKYYDTFMHKWLHERKGKLKEEYPFNLDGIVGREMFFEAPNSANLPQLWFTRIIAIDDVIYVFSINGAKGNRTNLENSSADYFSSLHMVYTENPEDQATTEKEEYQQKFNEEQQKQQKQIARQIEHLKHQREEAIKYQKQKRVFVQIRWLVIITLGTIFFFAAAIGLFFLIRHYYKKYD